MVTAPLRSNKKQLSVESSHSTDSHGGSGARSLDSPMDEIAVRLAALEQGVRERGTRLFSIRVQRCNNSQQSKLSPLERRYHSLTFIVKKQRKHQKKQRKLGKRTKSDKQLENVPKLKNMKTVKNETKTSEDVPNLCNAIAPLKLVSCLISQGPVTTGHDQCAFVDSQQRLLNICAYGRPLHGFCIVTRSKPLLKQLCTAHHELSQSHRIRDTSHRVTLIVALLSLRH